MPPAYLYLIANSHFLLTAHGTFLIDLEKKKKIVSAPVIMSSSGNCPFSGAHGSLWFGVVAGALLTYTHMGMLKASSTKKKSPVRAPGNKPWRMSKWIKHGGILRTQGLCGDFSKMPGSSVAQQTAETLEKLDEILKLAGTERKNLLAITIYLNDMEDFDEMNSVYDKWVDQAGLPTRLCVQAAIGHGAKIEIRAEAYYEEEDGN